MSSGRGSKPRSDEKSGGAKTEKPSVLRRIRLLATVLAIAATVVLAFGTKTFADYSDGTRAEHALSLPDAVRIWRQEAWRDDDFLAQVRLGDLYSGNVSLASGESKNASFLDPVEAYVWYYIALRPNHDYRADDNPPSSDTLYNIRNNALTNAEQLYYTLTFDQRLDARERILYILASRGAEGFLALGRIHSSGYYGAAANPYQPPKPQVLLCMRSFWDHSATRWLYWIWASVTGKPYPHPAVWKWVSNTPENLSYSLDQSMCSYDVPPQEPPGNFALTNTGASGSASPTATSPSAGGGTVSLSGSGQSSYPSPSVSISPGASSSSDTVSTVNSGGAASNYSQSYQGQNSYQGQGGYQGQSGYSTPSSSYSGSYGGGGYGGGGYGGGYGGGGGGYGGGYTPLRQVASVFVTNDAESLTYFEIAQSLGHPLAPAYVQNERAGLKYASGDASRIIADAERRARFWSPPFEFYPGATPGGLPHSDESLPTLDERIALSRVRDIPPIAVIETLDFLGYTKRGRSCGPTCLRDANRGILQFQKALGFEATGQLTPEQIVRLIRMAAVAGDAIAQDRLGIMYAKGVGVPQNFPRAEKWFIRAANQRFPDALFNLYVLYKVGPSGIEPDEHKAVTFYLRALAAGYNRLLCELQDLLRQADAADHDHPQGPRR